MRILICNKFMYPRGGDCNVALATARMLRAEGHEVRLFAMQYPDNLDVPDASGYVSRVDFSAGLVSKLKAVRRMLGKGDIRASFRRVMEEFRPDVVHLHNIHSYLSPVIGEIAASAGVRTVWTLHDYKPVCPAYSCRRPDGSNCEECFGGNLHVVEHRCMKGSRAASLMAHLEARRWHRARLERFCPAFICPSAFMASCMERGGFGRERLHVLPNFVDSDKITSEVSPLPGDYFCYIGRLSAEKGVETLLKAARTAGVRLVVTGDGPLRRKLEETYGSDGNIRFTGRLDGPGVIRILNGARASVMPSECYENNPLGVIESLCAGVPVIGADIAGIPELIATDSAAGKRCGGVLFPSGDASALARILSEFDPSDYDRRTIAADARRRFAWKTHYRALMEIYLPGDAKHEKKI